MEGARLTKSEYMSGAQCPRQLWWRRHEPDAIELQPNKVLQDLFDQGNQVGAIARDRFPGGVLIESYQKREARAQQTAAAISAGADVVFEAAFMADGVFVACDVLERRPDGWRLLEVKSSSSQKDEHVTDLAVQSHVLAKNAIVPSSIGVMHLNPEFRHPDEGDLFETTDVTGAVRARVDEVPDVVQRLMEILNGPLPDVKIGLHCDEPWGCAFRERCWPDDDWHITRLYGVGGKRADAFMRTGVHSIRQLPEKEKKSFVVRRQLKAMESGRRIVEPVLRKALEALDVEPLGFLDFETIARAVPVWRGMKPWQMAAAQFSYHELAWRPREGGGPVSLGSVGAGTTLGPELNSGHYGIRHFQHLAEGPEDARPLLAQRLVDATRNAAKVVTYSSFEKARIRALKEDVPSLATELEALESKLVDLLPIVRDNVYDPAFRGSFSLKYVLPALVPGLTYNDLVIVDGRVASVEIARLLFVADRIPAEEKDRVRKDLLAYCERDTWGMVRLLEVLRGMA